MVLFVTGFLAWDLHSIYRPLLDAGNEAMQNARDDGGAALQNDADAKMMFNAQASVKGESRIMLHALKVLGACEYMAVRFWLFLVKEPDAAREDYA